jgi:hypothetical protein
MRRLTIWVWVLTGALAATLAAGCGDEAGPSGPADDGGGTGVVEGAITPTFELGQTWVIGTVYRQANIRLPEEVGGLDRDVSEEIEAFQPHIPAAVAPPAGEIWSEVIYWQFGVINTDYLPDSESSFYELSLDPSGTPRPITIIKAIAPKEFNDAAISDQLDPVFYLVLRESDHRVRGVHYNYRVPGGRNTVVLELPENHSGQPEPGAEYNYFLVDYLLPIFPLDARDYSVSYGAGTEHEQMTVQAAGDSAAEVTFSSALDFGTVQQRWEEGEPWFTWSQTDTQISWRVDDLELAELMDYYGVEYITGEAFLEPAESIARKFRQRINLDAELQVFPGDYERTVPEAYYPWAGDFWPTSQGALVRGFSGRNRSVAQDSPTRLALAQTNDDGKTIEQRLGDLDRTMDRFQDTAEADRDDAFWDDVRDYWQEKRDVAREIRQYFEQPQTGFVARLRRGEVDLSNVNNWSPLDKWGLYLFSQGVNRPFEAAVWEAATQYHPAGAGWWGKCNGWSAAAILYDEPREDITVDLDLSNITGEDGTLPLTFQTADLKGWLTASNYSGYSQFYGERYNGEEQDENDIYPAVFHRLITYYIGTEHYPMVFDTTATEQVWNFPAFAYDMTITQDGTTMHVDVTLRFSTDGVSEDHIDGEGELPRGFTNHYTYDLEVDENNRVVGNGTWTSSQHPDFAWIPYQNDRRNSSGHRGLSESRRDELFHGRYAPNENPFLYTDIMERLVPGRVNAPVVCNTEPDDCPAGLQCQESDGTCVTATGGGTTPGCAGHERPEQAEALPAGGLTGQTICSNRPSHWAIELENGNQLTVTVTFPHSKGDIDIALMAPSGEKVASSTSTSDSERIVHTARQGGRYVLQVYGYNGAENDEVAISYTIEQPSTAGCADDGNEPNDTVANATTIGEVVDYQAAVCSAGDEDYYLIDLSGSYRALIEFDHGSGDLDLQLLSRDDPSQVIDRSVDTDNDEEVSGTGPALLHVYGFQRATGPYRLTVTAE